MSRYNCNKFIKLRIKIKRMVVDVTVVNKKSDNLLDFDQRRKIIIKNDLSNSIKKYYNGLSFNQLLNESAYLTHELQTSSGEFTEELFLQSQLFLNHIDELVGKKPNTHVNNLV